MHLSLSFSSDLSLPSLFFLSLFHSLSLSLFLSLYSLFRSFSFSPLLLHSHTLPSRSRSLHIASLPLPSSHSTHTISAVATAFDRSQNTLVAVAKIRGVFTDINDARRILREIRILRQLKHHRIVNLLEVSVCVCAHVFLPSRSVDHPVNSTFNPPPP